MRSVTPRVTTSEGVEMRLWTGYSGPAYSPTPMQDIYGSQIVQKVIKSVVVSSTIEGVMQRGSIIAVDATSGKCRLASDPADELLGVLVQDLAFVADETGANIVDMSGAVAKTGCFRMAALICGPPANVNQFEQPLRLKGVFMEGASIFPTTGP